MTLFEDRGAHVLVDGQFGSTGKGALAAWLAKEAVGKGIIDLFAGSITSCGPNSGHTSYFGNDKLILKQLPTFGVHVHLLGKTMPVYLSAGAVINVDQLRFEANMYPKLPIFVHPNAAVIQEGDIKAELTGYARNIASTQSGVGSALMRKIARDPRAIARYALPAMPPNVSVMEHMLSPHEHAYFVEVGQGFSLGIHSEFYPHVTSRECTVMQAIADARIPPRCVTKTYACFRTYPIRVGNLGAISSGDFYSDSTETSWAKLGLKEEYTTVTHRVRRVATFSMDQFMDAIQANAPDWVAINFLNYLDPSDDTFISDIHMARAKFADKFGYDFGLIGGYGPRPADWRIL